MSGHPHHQQHPQAHPGSYPGGRPYLPQQPQQPANGLGRGRARACTACRQVKLRCDARERAPAQCSRCEQNNLECKMDPHFKRVPARRQLEDVAKGLNHLRAALGIGANQPSPQSLRDYMSRSHRPDLRQLPLPGPAYQASVSDESMASEDVPNPISINFYALENESEVGPWTLGDVSFSAEQIRTLFKHFDKTHYKHGPFLEPCTSLHAYFQKSELLFWTVTMISCYLFSDYDDFYWRLLPHHRTLLSTRMLENRVTLSTVHAMLCMATWTYPVSTDYDDMTWMLCGAAIHTAMIMGLHKPGHGDEYSLILQREVGSQYTRNITWLSIFIISTGISSWLGMPPPLGAASHLEAIATLCRDLEIPKWYRGRADIHRQTVMLVNSVDSKSNFAARVASIRVYESELYRVRDTYDDVWNDDLEMEWHGAKLYLYGIAFVQPNNSRMTNTPETVIQAREILLKGFATAVECVTTVMNLTLPPTTPGENNFGVEDRVYQMGFYPKHFFRIGAFANYYLLWFIAVDSTNSSSDIEIARLYITLTYQLLMSFTHSFEHKRGGEAIKALAELPMNMSGPESSKIQTRGGAGFMYSFMTAEAGSAAKTRTLGIDTIGPHGAAHPKVHSSSESRQATAHNSPADTYTSQPAARHSPADTYTSQPTTRPSPGSSYNSQGTTRSPHLDTHHVQSMQYLQGSTPTSTHSIPEPLQSLPLDLQAPMTAHIPTSISGGVSQQEQAAMYSQITHTPPGLASQTPFPGQMEMDLSMLQASSMPAIYGQFGYSQGPWTTAHLNYEPQDPDSTTIFMDDMNLNRSNY